MRFVESAPDDDEMHDREDAGALDVAAFARAKVGKESHQPIIGLHRGGQARAQGCVDGPLGEEIAERSAARVHLDRHPGRWG